MQERVNRRGAEENFVQREHLKLSDLKERAESLNNRYLSKENIPEYPRPELHVTHLRHNTDRGGLRGIRGDEGFRGLDSERLLWWSLAVGPDDIQEAERRLLEETFSDRTEEQQGFLGKFATSPAFDRRSMYGSYRFTFPLEEMLRAYSEQLVQRDDERQMEAVEVSGRAEFYVWDHVVLALHVDAKVLKFDAERLKQNLKFCDPLPMKYAVANFDDFDEAEEVVKKLWPDCPSPLEKTTPLNQELDQN